jgi:hypothetical protein
LAQLKWVNFSAHKQMRLLKNSFGPSKARIDERRISNLESQSAPEREPGGPFSTASYVFGQASAVVAVRQSDGCRTLISIICDLQNQTVTVPQRVGFSERRGGKPI